MISPPVSSSHDPPPCLSCESFRKNPQRHSLNLFPLQAKEILTKESNVQEVSFPNSLLIIHGKYESHEEKEKQKIKPELISND